MINIYKNTKVYILVPAGVESGGPEFLNQLGYYLREQLNFKVFLYYIPINHLHPVPRPYKKYNNLTIDKIEDKENNLLIAPEVSHLLRVMHSFDKIRKVIWWLSLDNYFYDKFLSENKIYSFFLRSINKTFHFLHLPIFIELTDVARKKYLNYDLKKDYLISQSSVNICSARHVENSLIRFGFTNVVYISELLNEEFLKIIWDTHSKENIIAFNPKKGIRFTKKIIKKASDQRFIPIQNLSKDQVIDLLIKSKVYIDFGNHPGRDRLPREAAVLGCCVITNKRGGAQIYEDLEISDEYKFDETESQLEQIVKKIKECIKNYNIRIKDFESYRKSIIDEPRRFLNGLKEYFIEVN
jgi:hypothetical protein